MDDLTRKLGNRIRRLERVIVDEESIEYVKEVAESLAVLLEEAREGQDLPFGLDDWATMPSIQREILARFVLPQRDMINFIIDGCDPSDPKSYRRLEVTALCLHQLMDDARAFYGIPYNPLDFRPSVYGENGGKGGG